VSGKPFTDADGADAPSVVIINQTMARRFWPGESPLGRRIRILDDSAPKEVRGVVEDVRQVALNADVRPEIYLPYAQKPWSSGFLVVRAAGEPTGLTAVLRREFREIDPTLALSDFRSMHTQISTSLESPRFNTILLGIFAALALTLAAVGVFGVVSYSISQRTRDFAIRLALGANRGDILGMVVGQGFGLVLLGEVLGLGSSLVLTRLLSNMLFGVVPTDPVTYATVAGILSVVAVSACYLPSRRATKVDPVVALRFE